MQLAAGERRLYLSKRGRKAASALLLFGAACLYAPVLNAETRIVRRGDDFVVSGWGSKATQPAAGWQSIFQVLVDSPGALPMLGNYSIAEDGLRFRPRYAPAPDVAVRAVFSPEGGPRIEETFPPAARQRTPSTVVKSVYPSGGSVPANLLKLYLHFSAPMSRGEAWRHIRLLDANGAQLDLPFLEIDQELWDPSYQRLTVLFDPGRIKRGVMPREQAGGALEAGSTYTLLIDEDWRDAQGLPLSQPFRKRYRVAPEDRSPIEPKQWKIRAPAAGTREPLAIELGEALDHALMERLIGVSHAGHPITGRAEAEREETRWNFVPELPWQPGEYSLVIDSILEDLAGNKVGRAFDVDTFEPVTRRVTSKTVSVPFRIGAQ